MQKSQVGRQTSRAGGVHITPTLWLFQTMMRKIHNYTGSATVTLLFLLRKALIPNFGPNIQRVVVRLRGYLTKSFCK